MVKTFSFLFLFLFLASCGKGGSGGSGSGKMADLSEADLQSESAPVQAQTFDIEAKLSGFSREQEEKVFDAFDLIKQVVASDEFKQKVLNFKYNGKRQFLDNGGYSNEEIYKKILEGAEKLSPAKDNAMDLTLKSYYADAIVIGYTMPSIKTIYMNRKFLNKFAANEVAMNLTHEWLHKLGFKHAAKKTANRSKSVPYAVGYIMRSLAKKYM
jgi:hypothetical protein